MTVFNTDHHIVLNFLPIPTHSNQCIAESQHHPGLGRGCFVTTAHSHTPHSISSAAWLVGSLPDGRWMSEFPGKGNFRSQYHSRRIVMVTTIMTFVHWSKGEEAEGRGESKLSSVLMAPSHPSSFREGCPCDTGVPIFSPCFPFPLLSPEGRYLSSCCHRPLTKSESIMRMPAAKHVLEKTNIWKTY